MKPHSEMTPQKIVEQMRGEMQGQLRRLNSDGTEFTRVSVQEQAEAQEALQQIAQTLDGVQFVCAGCGEPTGFMDAACCECGGFVCQACRRTETEGECHHEAPNFPTDADD